MHALRALGITALLVLALGCRSISVSTDWDTSQDFSGYKSYAWLPPHADSAQDARLHNALTDSRVRHAVNTQMAEKGYRYSTMEGADLLVTYYLGLEHKLDVDTIYTSYGYGGYGYGYGGYGGYGPGSAQTRVSQYEEGTLMIDILTPAEKKLVWRGTASTRLGRESSPEKSTKTINSAVERMFKKFPPPQTK